MSKFFYSPTVGIDVSADFSYAAILTPNGETYKKPFRINHDVNGFNHLLKEIKKVEVEFSMETGDINGFIKPKHLVAFFGIDSSVNESGKFKGNQNKISKRGTRIGRRALYAVALASIRKNRNGVPINKVLLDYYQTNLKWSFCHAHF